MGENTHLWSIRFTSSGSKEKLVFDLEKKHLSKIFNPLNSPRNHTQENFLGDALKAINRKPREIGLTYEDLFSALVSDG